MRKFALLLTLLVTASSAALAQGVKDFNRMDVSGNFVYARNQASSGEQTVVEGPDTFSFQPCTADGADALGHDLQRIFCTRRGFYGFNASAAYNLTRMLGVKADFTGLFKTDQTVDNFGSHTDTNRIKDRTWELLGGVQIKNNSKSDRLKPFAQGLAGFARQTSHDVQTSTGPFNFTLDDRVTSFAMKLGGGVDVRISDRVDLRLIEVNYNPIFGRRRHVPGNADFDLTLAGKRADNFTIGAGIVIH